MAALAFTAICSLKTLNRVRFSLACSVIAVSILILSCAIVTFRIDSAIDACLSLYAARSSLVAVWLAFWSASKRAVVAFSVSSVNVARTEALSAAQRLISACFSSAFFAWMSSIVWSRLFCFTVQWYSAASFSIAARYGGAGGLVGIGVLRFTSEP